MTSPVIPAGLLEGHPRCASKSYLRLQGRPHHACDYLAILCVFQTCEFRGTNVLGFLLSGKAGLGPSTVVPPAEDSRKDVVPAFTASQ